MSARKDDRSVAPRTGSRRSRAKQSTPNHPRGYRQAGKPKKGERVMEAQLEARPPDPPVLAKAPLDDADQPPPKDPWWNDEREKVFEMVLAGLPQHQISRDLGRDRHTIGRWVEDDRFVFRLQGENEDRFRAMRQRRVMQTVRLTEKTASMAGKMLDKADANETDLNARLAARDWLQEFREQSRREDEIYGLDKQRMDIHHHGVIQHQHKHKGSVDVSFKAFLTGALRKMGVDPEQEEIDPGRADKALVEITERALLEGSFLEDLVEQEKQDQLAPMLASGNDR